MASVLVDRLSYLWEFDKDDPWSSPLVLSALLIAATVAFSWVLPSLNNTSKNRQRFDENQIPYAPETSLFRTLKHLSGPFSPRFLLEQARQGESFDVFRLNVPLANKFGGMFVIGNPALARTILTDPSSEKAGSYIGKRSKVLNSVTMFTSATPSPHWKAMRKGTAPAFSSREVHRMNQICRQHVQDWIDTQLETPQQDASLFDPAVQMTRLTLRVICHAAFEYDVLSDEEIDEFLHHIEVALKEFSMKQLFNPLRRKFWFLVPAVYRAYASARQVQALARRMLEHYRAKNAHHHHAGGGGEDDDQNKNQPKTVMRLIVENPQLQTDRQRIGEIGMFLVAGYDTTGYSLGTALVTLAEHPKVAQRLRSELMRCEQTKNDDETVEDCWRRCEYLQYVIKENYRYRPVAAMGSSRQLNHDLQWTIACRDGTKRDINLPRGSHLLMPQIVLHRNGSVYHKPDTFDPSRWDPNALPEAAPKQQDLERTIANFHPFSLGVRNCIGQALATAEIQSVLPRLIRQYDFTVWEQGQAQFFLTMKMAGYRLRATRAKTDKPEATNAS